MIVDRHTAQRMLVGEITQRRLPRALVPPRVGHIMAVRRELLGDVAGHIIITACRLSRDLHRRGAPIVGHAATVDDVSLPALGHDSLLSYVSAWLLERDQVWLANRCRTGARVATTLQAAEAGLAELDEATILTRWHRRWADLPVWAVEWQPAADMPTFLQVGAPRIPFTTRLDGRHVIDDGILDEDRGYYGPGVRPVPLHTELADRGFVVGDHRALTDAGEAVDPSVLHPHWERGSRLRYASARGRDTVAKNLGKRLRGR